jgi:hypothetical protein
MCDEPGLPSQGQGQGLQPKGAPGTTAAKDGAWRRPDREESPVLGVLFVACVRPCWRIRAALRRGLAVCEGASGAEYPYISEVGR